ncbi:MAG: PKD domain-containing protein, partial [Thermoplasmata archaeon]|nr:PKD domain-containing protein [Thermoplasmata archaeon]
EDGDELTVAWTSDGVTIGTGDTLDYKKLKPGTQTIKVTVSDGETSVEDEFTVVIQKEEESPALGGVFVLLAMLVGMAALMMRRKG